MWLWFPVIIDEEEVCSNCDSELTRWSKAYIKVWWPYKDRPDLSYLVCERCGPQPTEVEEVKASE